MIKNFYESIANIFKPTLTGSYPNEPIKKPSNYRGVIKYDESHCIFCDKCELVCPSDAIVFYQSEDGNKKYHYDRLSCIYCGECVRNCPKSLEALMQSEEKPTVGTKEDSPKEGWHKFYSDSKKSREIYKEIKKAKKS